VPSKRLRLTFPEQLITEPIVHEVSKRFDLVTNIRRADIRETAGWVVLEMTGTEEDLAAARAHLEEQGVRVSDVEAYLE
jgi:ABC-type methionine transport system ATPase subunit